MKRSILILCLSLNLGAAHAADMTAPVREIMAEAENGWSQTPKGDPRDYFDAERLQRLYSRDFARVYRNAAKFPVYEDGDSPLDYDIVVSGQDSCELRDIAIAPGAAVEGRTDVTVSFDHTSCIDPAQETGSTERGDPVRAELRFIMVEEDGHAAIDDIVRAGSRGSLKGELEAIAAQGARQ